jgi:ribosome-binding factor A
MARYDKVAEAIKREISQILQYEFKDPRLGFVTITDVEVTADLRCAKVFFSVLGKPEDYQRTKQALDSGLGFIRKLVAERINLKFAPEIFFREDRSAEYGIRIEEVLNQIKQEKQSQPLVKPRPRPRKERASDHKKSRRLHKKK